MNFFNKKSISRILKESIGKEIDPRKMPSEERGHIWKQDPTLSGDDREMYDSCLKQGLPSAIKLFDLIRNGIYSGKEHDELSSQCFFDSLYVAKDDKTSFPWNKEKNGIDECISKAIRKTLKEYSWDSYEKASRKAGEMAKKSIGDRRKKYSRLSDRFGIARDNSFNRDYGYNMPPLYGDEEYSDNEDDYDEYGNGERYRMEYGKTDAYSPSLGLNFDYGKGSKDLQRKRRIGDNEVSSKRKKF